MNALQDKLLDMVDVNWSKVGEYFLALLATIVLTYLIIYIIRFFVHQLFKRTHFIDEKVEQTIETILKNTSHYIAFAIIIFKAIDPFIDVKNLLVAGGVLGIIIGLGAQKVTGDVIAGFFMIFERQFRRGDFVHINGDVDGGTIEDLGFRVVKVRLTNGKLMTVPNGEIRKVENGNVQKRRIFESIVVGWGENPTSVKQLLQDLCDKLNKEHAEYLKKDDATGEYIEEYKIHGFSSLDATALGYRITIKATVGDEVYLEASQLVKEYLAQMIYDNDIKMAMQHVMIEKGNEQN